MNWNVHSIDQVVKQMMNKNEEYSIYFLINWKYCFVSCYAVLVCNLVRRQFRLTIDIHRFNLKNIRLMHKDLFFNRPLPNFTSSTRQNEYLLSKTTGEFLVLN
jgi:hypothetical protein